MTELGPLPEEWEVIPFTNSLGKRVGNVPDSIQRREYKPTGKYPIVDQSEKYIAGYTDETAKLYSSDLPIIIFGDHTRIFKFVDFPFAIGADGTKILNPNQDLFDSKYFYYCLTSLDIPSRGYNRHFKVLKEKAVVKSPLPEQKAIARVLSTIQAAIEAQDKIIAAVKELKKSLMRHLFTYGPVPVAEAKKVHLKETEIGSVPGHWEVVRLGDLFEIKQGKSLSPQHRLGLNPQPFLRTSNVFWGKIDLSTLDKMDFLNQELEQLCLKPGDLLVCEGGEIGRTAMWEGQLDVCFYQNHIHRLRTTRDDVYPLFYMYWMQAAYLLLRLYGGTGNKTTIPNLSQSRLKSFLLPQPSLLEQKEMAQQLLTLDVKLEIEENRKAALQELFKTMLHHLMSGKVRVKDLEATAA